MIALFTVIRNVQAYAFLFFGRPQSNDGLDEICDYRGAENGDNQRYTNRFELLKHEWLSDRVFHVILEVCGKVGIGGVPRQNSGQERANSAPDGVNTKGIERIVITEPAFDLVAEKPGNQPRDDSDSDRPPLA